MFHDMTFSPYRAINEKRTKNEEPKKSRGPKITEPVGAPLFVGTGRKFSSIEDVAKWSKESNENVEMATHHINRPNRP